jgi:hypothetical protein
MRMRRAQRPRVGGACSVTPRTHTAGRARCSRAASRLLEAARHCGACVSLNGYPDWYCALLGSWSRSMIPGRPRRGSSGPPRLAGSSPMPVERSAHANVPNGSTVVSELALRPGFSPQARMPPTARFASRGGRRGPLVLTAGPVSCSTGVTPPARWPRPNPVERAGVLALFLARGSSRGMGRRGDDDAETTRLGSASARRVGSRSRLAAGFRGDRRPTTLERAAGARYPDQGRPGRSERSSLRVPDANVRLAGGCRCRISNV